MQTKLLVIPIFGAFIGWMANYLTIKMLFHPHQPRKIPIISYMLWGILPRRQQELAAYIGERVEREFLATDRILNEMKARGIVDNLSESITTVVKNRVMMKIPSIVPRSWRNLFGRIVEDILKKEVPEFIEESVGKLTVTIKAEMHIKRIVEERVNSFNTKDIEKLATAELRAARVTGAIAGFFLGLILMSIISL